MLPISTPSLFHQDFVAFAVVDCGAEKKAGGGMRQQGSHDGCKDILQREPAVLSLFLAKGTRVDVESMKQLQGTVDAHAVPHVTQLLNEGQGHPPLSQSRDRHRCFHPHTINTQTKPMNLYRNTARVLSPLFCSRAMRGQLRDGCARCRCQTNQWRSPQCCECCV